MSGWWISEAVPAATQPKPLGSALEREALKAHADWGYVLTRVGWLLALAIVCTWLATQAFRTYQRSL